MKLLLTSNGLSNNSISKALFDLVGKKPEDTIITFIPTAANNSNNDKGWFVNDLNNIYKQGLKRFTITDIMALPKEEVLNRFEESDVLFWSGGDPKFLMEWIKKSGLKELLPELLKTKIWAGISAGSMVTSPDLATDSKIIQEVHDSKNINSVLKGLDFVDFYIRPHYLNGSSRTSFITEDFVREIHNITNKTIYAIDDMSAVKVDGDKIEVISEGEYHIFNEDK